MSKADIWACKSSEVSFLSCPQAGALCHYPKYKINTTRKGQMGFWIPSSHRSPIPNLLVSHQTPSLLGLFQLPGCHRCSCRQNTLLRGLQWWSMGQACLHLNTAWKWTHSPLKVSIARSAYATKMAVRSFSRKGNLLLPALEIPVLPLIWWRTLSTVPLAWIHPAD